MVDIGDHSTVGRFIPRQVSLGCIRKLGEQNPERVSQETAFIHGICIII